MKIDDPKLSSPEGVALTHTAVPNGIITSDTTISQLLAMLKSNGISLSTPCINLNLVSWQRLTLIDDRGYIQQTFSNRSKQRTSRTWI